MRKSDKRTDQVGFRSNKGMLRENNEDAFFVMPEENVYMVADGVGGNNAGELASRTAVAGVAEFIRQNPLENIKGEELLENYFKKCIEGVNERIFALSQKYQENRGMATTLVTCYLKDKTAYFINVGDSRAYLFRKGRLTQLTEDHTYVNSLLKLGIITQDEVKGHQKEHMITRALGAEESIKPDYYQTGLKKNDLILLCSDGLYGEVQDETIVEIIKKETTMSELADSLITQANRSGGRDNITVICIKIEGGRENE